MDILDGFFLDVEIVVRIQLIVQLIATRLEERRRRTCLRDRNLQVLCHASSLYRTVRGVAHLGRGSSRALLSDLRDGGGSFSLGVPTF